MTMNEHAPRMFGANVRSSIIAQYQNFGTEGGHAIAQRALWEIADCMVDVHGKQEAYRVCQTVADGLVSGAVAKPLKLPGITEEERKSLAKPPDTGIHVIPKEKRAGRDYVSLIGYYTIFMAGVLFAMIALGGGK